MAEENLQRKLEAINHLKAKYYIGTQESYRFITWLSNLAYHPQCIADGINQKLHHEFAEGNITYQATPERVVGLFEALEDASFEGFDELTGISPGLKIFRHSIPEEFLVRVLGIYYDNIVEHNPPEDYTHQFYEYFQSAHASNVQTDQGFGQLVYHTVKQRSDKYDLTFGELEEACNDALKKGVLSHLYDVNWKNKLSRKNFFQWEKNMRQTADETILSGAAELIFRIERDQVGHRWEYQKMVLERHFAHHNKHETIDEAISFIKKDISGMSNLLDTWSEDTMKQIRDSFIDPNRYKQWFTYVLHAVISNKNLVNKLLRGNPTEED